MAFVIYLAIAEAGLAPSAQRFVAVSQGAGDLGAAARILWSSLAAYLAVGIVVGAAIALTAPAIAGVFDFPPALENDAEELMRLVAIGIPLALGGAALANLQQGLGRFPAATATTALGAADLPRGARGPHPRRRTARTTRTGRARPADGDPAGPGRAVAGRAAGRPAGVREPCAGAGDAGLLGAPAGLGALAPDQRAERQGRGGDRGAARRPWPRSASPRRSPRPAG